MMLDADWLIGFHAYGMAAFTRILGMETKDADELCTSASKSIRNRNIHSYTYLQVFLLLFRSDYKAHILGQLRCLWTKTGWRLFKQQRRSQRKRNRRRREFLSLDFIVLFISLGWAYKLLWWGPGNSGRTLLDPYAGVLFTLYDTLGYRSLYLDSRYNHGPYQTAQNLHAVHVHTYIHTCAALYVLKLAKYDCRFGWEVSCTCSMVPATAALWTRALKTSPSSI